MRTLRIVFCVLACVCVACSVIIGVLFGFLWFLALAAAALLFAVLMTVFKGKETPKRPPAADFMSSPEENARRNEAQKDWKEQYGNGEETDKK